MNHLASRLTLFVLLAVACAVQAENGKFPDDFKIGAASSAMQVEGAWDIDGRGPSVWDTFTHKHPEKIADGRNTNDTADSYYFYEDDIKAAKSMGVSDRITFVFPTEFQTISYFCAVESLSFFDLVVAYST